MKYLLVLPLMILSQTVFSQINLGEVYHVDQIIGHDLSKTQEFTMTKVNLSENNNFVFGNTIVFNPENTFGCGYSAPCGNDCFPSSFGTFEIVDDSHIKLFVKEFRQAGFCEQKQIELNIDLGIYRISKTSDNEIKLTKSDKKG